MSNLSKYMRLAIVTTFIVASVMLFAGCVLNSPTQDVLPTPTITPQPSPESVKISFETVSESVARPNATDVTVHESIDLGPLKGDYFAMPTYRTIDVMRTETDFKYNQNVLVSNIEGNEAFYGIYVLTDEGMVWNEPNYFYGEFTMHDTKIQYFKGYAEVDGVFYRVLKADHMSIYTMDVYWENTDKGVEVTIDTEFGPVRINLETKEIQDVIGGINRDVVNEILQKDYVRVASKFGKVVFAIGRYATDKSFYYLDLNSNKLVELAVPVEIQGALLSNRCKVVKCSEDAVLLVKDYGSASVEYRQYFICDSISKKVIDLEDLVGEDITGCCYMEDKVICAGEEYYWSVDVDSLEVKKLLGTKSVAVGFTETENNNASFVIVGEQGNYKLYDFAKGTISSLDQLGRWAELEAANYVVSPDGRKLVVYGGTQNGCIQFGVLNCDTNTFVDVVREAPSDMTEETRIWWYKDSAVAVAQEDRQIISVYTIK